MTSSLSLEQRALRDSIGRYIAEKSPVAWVRQQIDDEAGLAPEWLAAAGAIGWFAMLVPDEFDGGSVSGAPVRDATLIAAEVGHYLQPGPFVQMNVVAHAIATHGSDALRRGFLPKIVQGQSVATWAYADQAGNLDYGAGLEAVRTGDAIVLNGTRGYVIYGDAADLLVVVAKLEGRVVQIVVPGDAAGIVKKTLTTLDPTRRMVHCEFHDVRVPSDAILTEGTQQFESLLYLAAALNSADTVGALGRLFDMTIEYAKTRVAFGRPIGSFQSIKHVLADQLLYVETCRAGLAAAVAALDGDDDDLDKIVLMSSAYIADVANDVAQECLQVHGGIGYTWEHDLHFYLRRIRSNASLFGGSGWMRERLCRAYGLSTGGTE